MTQPLPQPVSLRPVVDAIRTVEDSLRAADLQGAPEFERERTLRILGGIRQQVEALCLAPDPEQSYWVFNAYGR